MPFYRTILKQAWSLTLRHKYLWWFGIFAALLGNGGELEILFNNAGGDPGKALFPAWQKVASTGVFSLKTFGNIINLFKQDTLNMLIFLIMSLAIALFLIFLIWLAVVGQAALVHNSAALLNQKKNSLKSGWDMGLINFWPVLTINILVKAVIYLLLTAF